MACEALAIATDIWIFNNIILTLSLFKKKKTTQIQRVKYVFFCFSKKVSINSNLHSFHGSNENKGTKNTKGCVIRVINRCGGIRFINKFGLLRAEASRRS